MPINTISGRRPKILPATLRCLGLLRTQNASFLYDITPPVSYVEYPVNSGFYQNITIISGTANDMPTGGANRSGIANVKVLIKCVQDNGSTGRAGKYYNGVTTGWDSIPSVQSELPVDNISDLGGGLKLWTKTTGLPAWYSTEQYQIQCKSYDAAGNPEEPLYTELRRRVNMALRPDSSYDSQRAAGSIIDRSAESILQCRKPSYYFGHGERILPAITSSNKGMGRRSFTVLEEQHK